MSAFGLCVVINSITVLRAGCSPYNMIKFPRALPFVFAIVTIGTLLIYILILTITSTTFSGVIIRCLREVLYDTYLLPLYMMAYNGLKVRGYSDFVHIDPSTIYFGFTYVRTDRLIRQYVEHVCLI